MLRLRSHLVPTVVQQKIITSTALSSVPFQGVSSNKPPLSDFCNWGVTGGNTSQWLQSSIQRRFNGSTNQNEKHQKRPTSSNESHCNPSGKAKPDPSSNSHSSVLGGRATTGATAEVRALGTRQRRSHSERGGPRGHSCFHRCEPM